MRGTFNFDGAGLPRATSEALERAMFYCDVTGERYSYSGAEERQALIARRDRAAIEPLLKGAVLRRWIDAGRPTDPASIQAIEGIGLLTMYKLSQATRPLELRVSSAKMPSSMTYGRSSYQHVGVCELHRAHVGESASCLSTHARAVRAVRCVSYRCYAGSTTDCAAARAASDCRAYIARARRGGPDASPRTMRRAVKNWELGL
jgi:hypothetical protein